MRKLIIVTAAGALMACLLGAWGYSPIKADASAIAAGTFAPSSIDVMQLTREAGPMPAQQFAAF